MAQAGDMKTGTVPIFMLRSLMRDMNDLNLECGEVEQVA